MLLSFFHTCASKQHHDLHDRESLILSLSYTSGNFCYRTWLVYSNDGLPQTPQVFVSKQVGCTPTQFLLLSFHTFIALVHPLHGNPYSLTLISIDGHLHSPLIRLVDVRLSPSLFCLLHNHRLFLVQCYVHGSRTCITCKLKRLENIKSMKQLLGFSSGLCMMIAFLCDENET